MPPRLGEKNNSAGCLRSVRSAWVMCVGVLCVCGRWLILIVDAFGLDNTPKQRNEYQMRDVFVCVYVVCVVWLRVFLLAKCTDRALDV